MALMMHPFADIKTSNHLWHPRCACVQVLMQSFLFADRLKDKGTAEEAKVFGENCVCEMLAEPEVTISDLFRASPGKGVHVIASIFAGLQARCK
jgi:hypothetical protein